MNLFQRILSILCPPRLPTLGREDVANSAEYHNRLNRHREADINAPGFWAGHISIGRDGRLSAAKVAAAKDAEEMKQPVRRRARLRGHILGAAQKASR
jgi:hypothetical protein